MTNTNDSKQKISYVYMAIPSGIVQHVAMSGSLLKHKMAECQPLKAELHSLRAELSQRQANDSTFGEVFGH